MSEVSQAVKRTLEGTFDRVRVRGEISGFKRAASGHLYLALKDENAVLDGVCWRGTAGKLAVQPEDGMEVIATGRLTTYPGRSKLSDRDRIALELAGEGALLKLLEERRRKLAAEGLFAEERKRPLPFLPDVIGVVTSPTGAVIRDILHRLADRFPRRVLVWPVLVQGDGAAAQVAAAIEGFNAPPRLEGSPCRGLIVLIVARGGGSPGRPLGLQRGGRGAGRGGIGNSTDFGRWPRDRYHPGRLRRRPAGADADGGGRDGGAGAA